MAALPSGSFWVTGIHRVAFKGDRGTTAFNRAIVEPLRRRSRVLLEPYDDQEEVTGTVERLLGHVLNESWQELPGQRPSVQMRQTS